MSSSTSTSCRRLKIMARGPNLIRTMILAAALILTGSRADAQDQSPSPRMLLNLDLFTPQSNPRAQASQGNDSMLEQLRTLRSMGYLSADGPLPEVDDDPDEPDAGARFANQKNAGASR